jgi:hypothetical protein
MTDRVSAVGDQTVPRHLSKLAAALIVLVALGVSAHSSATNRILSPDTALPAPQGGRTDTRDTLKLG